MKILGLCYQSHDSGVALIENDKILYVSSEERHTRIKNDTREPISALKDCLMFTKTRPKDIDIIAISGFKPFKNFLTFGFQHRGILRLTNFKNIKGLVYQARKKYYREYGAKAAAKNIISSTGFPQYIVHDYMRYNKLMKALKGFRGKVVHVDHHTGHLGGAYYTSGMDDCLCAVIEGFDNENTTVFDIVKDGKVTNISSTPWPHSPGYFYRLITLILGFNVIRHPGKITGLAAYGDPKVAYDKIKSLMWVKDLELRLSPKTYTLQTEYLKTRKIPKYFSGISKEDLSAAFQQRLEDCILELIKRIYKKTKKKNLVMAGGCVANVKLNQRINELGLFDNIYIHPGMGDVGLALGSALRIADLELKKRGKSLKPFKLDDVYFGPGFSEKRIKAALDNSGLKYKKFKDIEKEVAKLLKKNHVIARFDGRMEYGPRALGNRSILYPAVNPKVNDWLNKRLNRTEFMPFAPVTLEEYTKKCYKQTKGTEYTAKFMTICYDCTPWMKKTCPAVVHVDGTARPQIIRKKDNPSYYKIVDEYRKMTKIPTIVNTSFNMHEEPIVCTPEDAIRSFLNGHLDYLAMGDYLIKNPD